MFAPDYSPFDALGLDYGAYNVAQIRRAFLRASLRCHPDKRPRELAGKWPLQSHVVESRDFLMESLPTEYLTEYKSYPRTFSPERPGKEAWHPPRCPLCTEARRCRHAQGFRQCEECWMVLPVAPSPRSRPHRSPSSPPRDPFQEHRLEAHSASDRHACEMCPGIGSEAHYRSEHPEQCCELCEEFTFAPDLEQHFLDHHTLEKCRGCRASRRNRKAVQHIRNEHYPCPIRPCKQICSASTLRDHLGGVHLFADCEGCDFSAPECVDHVTSDHSWRSCPFEACGPVKVLAGTLWKHASERHGWVRCPACATNEHDFADDIEHAAQHKTSRCPYCAETCEVRAYDEHLILAHQWLRCPHCSTACPDQDELSIHESDHHLTSCSECSRSIPYIKMKDHMVQSHGHIPCPFCSITLHASQLCDHLTESHRPCPRCDFRASREELRHHLARKHDVEECIHCAALFPTSELTRHVEAAHYIKCCCGAAGLPLEVSHHTHGPLAAHIDKMGSTASRDTNTTPGSPAQSPSPGSGAKRSRNPLKCERCRKLKIAVSLAPWDSLYYTKTLKV